MQKSNRIVKYKNYNYRRAKRSLERKLLWKRWKRTRNRITTHPNYTSDVDDIGRKDFFRIRPPQDFSFINHPNDTIAFIRQLEICYSERKKVFVNLKHINRIDYSAITVLLSVMFTFQSRGIMFNGNYPKDKQTTSLLIQSGFFKYLYRKLGSKVEYAIGNQNQMFTQANRKVVAELGYPIMVEASNTIWGENRFCKGLQRILLELMQNTNNHAVVDEKGVARWWLSVNHNKELKKVSFVFVDYGVGVFESLKNKPVSNKWFGTFDKIKSKLLHGNNAEVLKLLLEGDLHLTVTGQHYRGKGLPGIRQVFSRNQISNLHIITNNVYSDVSANKYTLLSEFFNGTFVYWELNESNHSLPWTI